jgi:DEAD/DEAH box helicase domain-containing protein
MAGFILTQNSSHSHPYPPATFVIYFLGMLRQLILDVETKKTFDEVGGYFPEKLGISFVGAIERVGYPESGAVTEVRHELFEPDLPKLFPVLERADIIVGFNSDNFDLPALTAYYRGDIKKLPSLDLLSAIKNAAGHRVSLDAVAIHTLGTQKTGHGLDAIHWYQTGELDKIARYCMRDVEITRDLFDYGRVHHRVKFLNHWNNPVEIEVDFTPQVAPLSGTQMSLV